MGANDVNYGNVWCWTWAAAFALSACSAPTPPSPPQPPSTSPQSAVPEVSAQGVVAAFEHNFGAHPSLRRNHSKGVCAVGTFTGNPDTQAWSRSALFSGKSIPVVARFSLPGGDPEAPDAAPSPRGMALEFQLPDGNRQHMTMLNVPVFSAATPQSFYEGLLAAAPDPATGKPDPERMRAYRNTHPDSAAQASFMQSYRPPTSYATSRYYGIHAFYAINAKDARTPVKWQFDPEDGEQALSPAEMQEAPRDFLANRLQERLAKGPARWTMRLIMGQPSDPTDNPTLAWPEDRQTLAAGTLALTAAGADAGDACDTINYDPMVMADGLQPSNDPILRFRSSAYAVSFAKRMSERSASKP